MTKKTNSVFSEPARKITTRSTRPRFANGCRLHYDSSDPAWEREGLVCEVNYRNFDDDDSRLIEDFLKGEYSVPTLIVLQTIPEFRRKIHPDFTIL